ncbi:MAG: two-component regulator propeller domain-containing protein, partial [Acidobacteriota bacterium]
MRTPKPLNIFLVLFSALLSAVPFFLAQNTSQSPSASPDQSPSPSPSPTPSVRAPSPTPLPGAQNFHQWGSITVFNGLPSDSVRAIAQTPDGVMWFGTDNGLARFDGRRVQTIPLGDAESHRVLALALESTDALWVGTDSGAYVLMNGNFMPVEGTSGMGITSILIVSNDAFLGTDTGLVLNVAAGGSGALRTVEKPLAGGDGAPISVTCLVRSADRVLACAGGKGVVEIGGTAVTDLVTSPRPPFVRSLLQTDDGKLWFGTNAAKGASGVYVGGSDSKVTRIPAPTADVFALEKNSGSVWAGTERYGLFQFDGAKLRKNYTFENTSGGLRSNMILTMFTDREGVLWIGTNRGVSRFDTRGALQETVSDIPNSNFIRSLYRTTKGEIYAGSNRGLFMKGADNWQPLVAYGNKPIYALSEDRSERVVVGTVGTDIYPSASNDSGVWSFADFRNVKYAAVNRLGLLQIKPTGNVLVQSDPSISSLCGTVAKLYIGTTGNGLFSFDGRTMTSEIAPEVLRSGTIWKISVGEDNALWIAGQHGVFRVRSGEVEKIIEAEDVRDVVATGDELWAATTTRGLLHARRDDRFGWLVSAVGFEQGLPSEKAFGIVRSDEGFLIATNRGVVTYKPGRVAPKLIPVRVLSQRSHDLAELASKVELDYPQNSLLVEVAGQSSRTFPEEFQYAFVLKNGKGEEVARQLANDAEYAPADLAAGEYTIESIAFNRDLLPSEPLMIKFSVAKAPFPWTATALGA